MAMVLRRRSMLESSAAATMPTAAKSDATSFRALRFIGIHSSQIMLEQGGWEETGHRAAPGHDNAILPLPNMAHPERSLLNVPCAPAAERFIATESGLYGAFVRDASGQDQRIFQRHAAALPQIWRTRVSRVAEQSDASGSPVAQRRKIVCAVLDNRFRRVDQSGDGIVPFGEALKKRAFPLVRMSGALAAIGCR